MFDAYRSSGRYLISTHRHAVGGEPVASELATNVRGPAASGDGERISPSVVVAVGSSRVVSSEDSATLF